MKRGFTLVELSIVLVIIGLLIGGILVAQSIISAAKINAQVKQIQEFDVAVSNFRTKYGQLPGDSLAMGCWSNNCNDGTILDSTAYGASLHSDWVFSSEIANFWPDLQESGLVTGESYTQTIPGSGFNTGASKNAPEAVLGQKSTIIMAGARTKWPDNRRYNYYVIADHSAVTVATIINERSAYSVSPNEMMALDKKMDDGLPVTGKVISRGTGLASGAYIGWAGASASCVTSSRYVPSDQLVCSGMVELLSSTGEQ